MESSQSDNNLHLDDIRSYLDDIIWADSMWQNSQDLMCQDTELDLDHHFTSLEEIHSPEWDACYEDDPNMSLSHEPIIK